MTYPVEAASKERRILVLSGRRTISPRGSGGSRRLWHIVDGLKRAGFVVTIWAIDPTLHVGVGEDARSEGLRADREFHARPRVGVLAKFRSLLSPLPEDIWMRPANVSADKELEGLFDLALFMGPGAVELLPNVRSAGLLAVLDGHDVPSRLIGRIAGTLRGRIARWRMRLDARKWRRFERRMLVSFDQVVAVSDDDAAVMRSLGARSVVVRPNGVDLPAYPFHDHSTPNGANLLMTADFSYLPNLDAARWLTSEIFPMIRSQTHAASLRLVGRHAPRPPLPKGVSSHADVPEVQPFFDDTDVFVVPLRAGSGTRLKVIEAMAKGVPIVSTTIGCEGLGVVHGTQLLVADTAHEFAAATVRLLDDVGLRRNLATNARSLAQERFDWQQITDAYAEDLRSLLAGNTR